MWKTLICAWPNIHMVVWKALRSREKLVNQRTRELLSEIHVGLVCSTIFSVAFSRKKKHILSALHNSIYICKLYLVKICNLWKSIVFIISCSEFHRKLLNRDELKCADRVFVSLSSLKVPCQLTCFWDITVKCVFVN